MSAADVGEPNGDHVLIGRCPACGYLMFPVPEASPCGHDETPQLTVLDEPGVVHSHTRAWQTTTENTIIVMVDLLGGALRVSAPLREADEIAIGDEVRLRPGGTRTPYEFVRA